jgi:CRISPR/Cas system endoribonuclease Cas6 (RAMP superfamily)
VSWSDLRKPPAVGAWQVRFVTPTCTRRRNRAAPLLNPDALALGLAERWRLLDPATAPALPWLPGPGPVWVSDLDGHTEVQLLSRRTRQEEVISGFIGRVRYVCDQGNEAERAAFDALLNFAAFAGAGSHTAYGFGVVVPEPTWQPPTIRAGGSR